MREFLKEINLPKNEILFLHIKLKGMTDHFSYNDISKQILYALNDLYKPKTILIPTFTYSYTNTGTFNRISSPSEVGRFSEEVRNQYTSLNRTINPVFNVIDTNNYLLKYQLKEESAFGEDSMFNLLHELGHVIVNINIEELIGTYLHFLEYFFNVPYRYKKNFPGKVVISDQEKKLINYEYHVRDLDKNPIWRRQKIITLLNEEGVRNNFSFNELKISWAHSKNIDSILGSKLKNDGNYLIT